VVELAEQAPELGLLRLGSQDPGGGQAVEDAELLFAQALVTADRLVGIGATGLAEQARGLAGPHISAGQDDVGPFVTLAIGEPAAQRLRLPLAQVGQLHVDVAQIEVDPQHPLGMGGVAGDVAGALTMAHDPQARGPVGVAGGVRGVITHPLFNAGAKGVFHRVRASGPVKGMRAPYIERPMASAEMKPPRPVRVWVAIVVALLHLAAIAMLIRAFAPELGSAVMGSALQAFDVTLDPPPAPAPVPTAKPISSPEPPQEPASAAPAGKKATPRAVTAPAAKVNLSPVVAPSVAATGSANSAGSSTAGEGSGAGGIGEGLGSGGVGSGTGGGGGASRPVKIAGDIVSARDYPRATRDLRLGSAVTLALTVNAEGRVSDCRIVRASRDPEADRITCALATQRFRFKPAHDAAGRPVTGVYGWQQRWFAPAAKDR